MSAYMVEDSTINGMLAFFANKNEHDYLVYMLKEHGYDVKTKQGLIRLGVRMYALNMRGVNTRYGRDKDFHASYQFKTMIPPTEIQAFKSLQCWLYQCSEGSTMETRLYKLMTEIKYSMAVQIVDSLPAYELAKWG